MTLIDVSLETLYKITHVIELKNVFFRIVQFIFLNDRRLLENCRVDKSGLLRPILMDFRVDICGIERAQTIGSGFFAY